MTRLLRSDCSGPGIARRGRGRGFEYLDEEGNRITDPEVLARIRALGIPPAWRDVWICPSPRGHLQATGTDAAGRKQYLYHEAWRTRRDAQKFADMERFARALPALRERVDEDLEGEELSRTRVLACSVRLLDRGFFRIGSEEYTESFGLATMLKQHVTVGRDGEMVFDYPAKSGIRRVQAVVDPVVAEIVAALKRRRGGGDALAAVALAVSGESAHTKSARKRAVKRAVEEVARYLGNTPAVCRASYIDPRVFDAYRAGLVIGRPLREAAETERGELPIHQRALEEAVLDLIDERDRAAALERVAA